MGHLQDICLRKRAISWPLNALASRTAISGAIPSWVLISLLSVTRVTPGAPALQGSHALQSGRGAADFSWSWE